MNSQIGSLTLITTPIGNLKDITLRGLETLFTVDVLLCEDTRVTGKLLEKFKNYEFKDSTGKETLSKINTPKLIPYHDHNEQKMIPQVISWLMEGKNIGLVSDAGTPLISDPGYKLVRECITSKISVISVPGASSILTALQLSGLPPDKFLCIGYLPRKSSQRQTLFKSLTSEPFKHLTVIALESPYRILTSLEDLEKVLPETKTVVCRELTKLFEEIVRGTPTEIIAYFEKKKIKGEIVLLFEI